MQLDANLDPPTYVFDVFTSSHDDVKCGRLFSRWSTVSVSRQDYPTYAQASEVAACLAVAVHGGMPTAVLPVY